NDNNDKNDSTPPSKKQSTLPQYFGYPIYVSKVPKFEQLVLYATILAKFAFR
ncbi:31303_t:CDS:1, partial [Gigaspora margarita]